MDFEQLYIRKELEDFIEMPDVPYTLILEFVGPYEWSDLKHIPRGVICTCMLNLYIYVGGKMVLGNIKKLKLYNVKVDVMRTKWINEEDDDDVFKDDFAFKLIIGRILYTLTYGVALACDSVDHILFVTGSSSSVIFRNLQRKN